MECRWAVSRYLGVIRSQSYVKTWLTTLSLLHNTTPVFYDWTVSQLSTVWHAFYRLERIFLRHLDTGARRWTMAMLIRGEMGGNELEGRPPPGIMKRYV